MSGGQARPAASPLLGLGLAALAYVLAGVGLTWPLALNTGGLLFGDYGDMRGRAWDVWAKSNGLLDAPVNPLLGAPFGLANLQVVNQPLYEWPVLMLAKLSNEIAAINALTIAAFPLTAIVTFVVLERLLHDKAAAFLGGLAFGFLPAAVLQTAGGHGEYALNVFIPLFLLALFHNQAHHTLRSALPVALAYAGITLVSLYAGYFAIFLGLFFASFDYVTARPPDRRAAVRSYLYCAVLAALLVVPFELRAIHEQFASSRQALETAGHVRGFGDLAVYSARLWDYLLPSIDHPAFGSHLEAFVRDRLQGSNAFEQTLYLGWVPLGLVAAGAVMSIRGRLDADLRRLFLVFACLAAWMFFVSLPPRIGDTAPTLSYFAYEVAPMFRVYARSGIFVGFLVACAAAVVLVQLSRRLAPSRYRATVAAFCALLAFEYWSVPPSYAMPVDRPPEVYEWLSRQPGDPIVAEYPMVSFDEATFYSYPFWQRVHRKRLVNGASPDNVRAWEFYRKVRDLGDPGTPALLKAAGVEYVIVHKAMYREGPIPQPLKRYYPPSRAALTFGGAPAAIPAGLRLHTAFGNDLVFVLP